MEPSQADELGGEVRPSGQALSLARKWLNLGEGEGLQDGWAPPAEFAKPRPLGLGLGAKPQRKQQEALQGAAALGKVLGKRLKGDAGGAERDGGQRPSSGSARPQQRDAAGAASEPPAGDSDEEGGRGTAIARRKLASDSKPWSSAPPAGKKRKKAKHAQQHTPG